MESAKQSYEGWAIVELMGHRRIAGRVSQAEQYGTAMLRIDVPSEKPEEFQTQFYGGPSIYCLTPTTEEVARAIAVRSRPTPVHAWEFPQLPRSAQTETEGPCGQYGCIN